MTALPEFDFLTPNSIDEALAVVGESDFPYAGGTELLVAMRLGLLRPRALVNVKTIRALKETSETPSGLEIGAATTHQQLIDFLDGRIGYEPFREMLKGVGNPRVRSVGTIGGNLCFAEPRSDIATLLVALDAQVELVSAQRGARMTAVSSFITGAYVTDRRPDEIMTRVLIPPSRESRYTYVKFQTGIRPTAGVAVLERADLSVRIAVGAVCETPAVHELVSLTRVEPEAIAESIETATDMFGSERFKRHITAVFLRRAISSLGESHG